jgi:hypothetical protein
MAACAAIWDAVRWLLFDMAEGVEERVGSK